MTGLFALTGAAFHAAAATVPVAENFNDGVANGFTTAGSGGGYTIVGSPNAYAYEAIVSSTGPQNFSSAVNVTGLPTTGYEVSTKFKLTAFSTAGAANVGLGAHGDTADFSTGTQYRLLYQLAGSDAGRLHLMRNGSIIGYSTGSIAPGTGQDYVLSFRVTPVSGSQILRGTLSNGTSTIAVETSQSTLLGGAYFGYRTAVNASNITVRYDDFGVREVETDHLVTGDLTVLGNTDLVGNTLKLGGTGTGDEAVTIDYTESGSTYTQSTVTTRDSSIYTWAQNGAATPEPKMRLGADNTLTLFNASGAPGIVLNPQAGSASIQGDLIVSGTVSLPTGSFLQNTATAQNAISFGGGEATADEAIAIGMGQAYGVGSATLNVGIAHGAHSVAMNSGYTLGWASTAMGLGVAEGAYTMAAGAHTRAQSFSQVALGYHNVPQGDPLNWIPTDDLFVIGNGGENMWEDEVTTTPAPSNAFVVHKNGNVRAAGNVQSKGGFRTPPMGDLDMGDFTAGANPAAPLNASAPGLNAGLRYPGE